MISSEISMSYLAMKEKFKEKRGNYITPDVGRLV